MCGLAYCCIWLMQFSTCVYCCTTWGFQSTKSLLEHFCFGLDIEHPTLWGNQPWTKLDLKAYKKSRTRTINILQRTNNCPKFRISCPSKAIDLEDLDTPPKFCMELKNDGFQKGNLLFHQLIFRLTPWHLPVPSRHLYRVTAATNLEQNMALGLTPQCLFPLWIQLCTGAPSPIL